MSYFGNNNPRSAMGELEAIEPTPMVQISAQYGILNTVFPITSLSGTYSAIDSKFVVNSGVDAGALSTILTNDQMYVKAGQGGSIIFDAMFDTPVLDSQQVAGFINSEDSFSFGYIGEDFGVIHYFNGKDELLHLEFTVSGSGTATVTVDGIGYPVTLTAGTVEHNASEVAVQLNGVIPNYNVAATGDHVKFLALLPQARGAFSFTGSTATVVFTQTVAGQLPIIDFIPQANMNGLPIFEGFNPQLLNHYKIVFDGNIHYYIQNQETSNFDLVHTIKYLNTSDIPHVSNPTFRGGWLVRSLGSTTNLTIQGSKMGMFIQGKNIEPTFVHSDFHSADFNQTEQSLLTIRNRFEFKDRINRSDAFLKTLSLATESTRAMFFEIYLNPTFTTEVLYEYIDEEFSIIECSKNQSTISSFESKLGTYTTSQGASAIVDLGNLHLTPDDVICIAAVNARNQTDSGTVSITWVEDL